MRVEPVQEMPLADSANRALCHALIDELAVTLSNCSLASNNHVALSRADIRCPAPRTVVFVNELLDDAAQHRLDTTFSAGLADNFQRWLLICHCLALVRGRHNKSVRTGEALANVWYSPARVARLLDADILTLMAVLPGLARLLQHRQVVVNWRPLCDLALYAGVDERQTEVARLEIARGYATAQYNSVAK